MAKTFISYRRVDNAAFAGRIYDRLTAKLGRRNVFKDVDDIPPGVDFPEYIQSSLRQCAVVLAIIGPGWLSAADAHGRRRLDDPADFVRIEIETALDLGLVLIPVLIDRASMPAAAELPESLQRLARINAIEVRNDPDFTHDAERLIAAIEHGFTTQRQTSRALFLGGRGRAHAAAPLPAESAGAAADVSPPRGATAESGAGANVTGRSPALHEAYVKAASDAPGPRSTSEHRAATSGRLRTRTPVAMAGAALLLLALAASGFAIGPSVITRLFTVERQNTVTVTTTPTATTTATASPTIPSGFAIYHGLSGTYTIDAPSSWAHYSHSYTSQGAPYYVDEFKSGENVTYPPDVLIQVSQGYNYQSDGDIETNQLQTSGYSSVGMKPVLGHECPRADAVRSTPGGTFHAQVIVCRPVDANGYVYVIELAAADANFSSASESYFTPMLSSCHLSG